MATYKFELTVETMKDSYLNEREFRQFVADVIRDASEADEMFPIVCASISYIDD